MEKTITYVLKMVSFHYRGNVNIRTEKSAPQIHLKPLEVAEKIRTKDVAMERV